MIAISNKVAVRFFNKALAVKNEPQKPFRKQVAHDVLLLCGEYEYFVAFKNNFQTLYMIETFAKRRTMKTVV